MLWSKLSFLNALVMHLVISTFSYLAKCEIYSKCKPRFLSTGQHVIMSTCQLVNITSCHHVNLPVSDILAKSKGLSCKFVRSLFTDQEIHESGEKVLFQDDTEILSWVSTLRRIKDVLVAPTGSYSKQRCIANVAGAEEEKCLWIQQKEE